MQQVGVLLRQLLEKVLERATNYKPPVRFFQHISNIFVYWADWWLETLLVSLSTTHSLTESFPIYKNKHWTIRWWDHTNVPPYNIEDCRSSQSIWQIWPFGMCWRKKTLLGVRSPWKDPKRGIGILFQHQAQRKTAARAAKKWE